MDQKPLRVTRISGIVVGVVLGVWLLLNAVSLLFEKTLWDALKVLAAPLTVGAAVPLLNWLQKKRELDVENQRAQDEALQAYLDQMSQLLTDNKRPLRRARPGDHLSAVARARTLAVLPRLDGVRKGVVLRFLYESDLISKGRHVVPLEQADFSGTYLSDLSDVHWSKPLSRRMEATSRGLYLTRIDLSNAELSRVNLSGAYLDLANLSGSDLSSAYLADVHLRWARLYKITMRSAHIARANLRGANLEEADLKDTSLWPDVDLREANLKGAKGIDEWVQEVSRPFSLRELTSRYVLAEAIARFAFHDFEDAKSLRSRVPRKATMPNGQKYEDWLKSKGHGENRENSSPS